MSDAEALWTAALACHERGAADQARTLVARLLAAVPDHVPGLTLAGALALEAEDAAGALSLFQRAQTLDPDSAVHPANCGLALEALGRERAAREAFQTAVARDRAQENAWEGLARLALEAEAWEDAVTALDTLSAIRPGDGVIWGHLGRACQGAGRLGAAETAYRTALTLGGQPPAPLWFNLGIVLEEAGQASAAREAWEGLIAEDPGHTEAWCRLVDGLHAAGLTAQARARAEAALARGVPDPDGRLAGARVYLLAQGGQPAAARREAEAVVAVHPGNWRAWRAMAEAAMALGDPAAARAAYEQVRRLVPVGLGVANIPWALLHDPTLTATDVRQGIAAHAATVTANLPAFPPLSPRPRTGPLRVGFLSPDLRGHVVARYLAALWPHLPPERVQVVALPWDTVEDTTTAQLRRHVAQWLPVRREPVASLVPRLRDLNLDVVVDVAGFTGEQPMHLLAARLAPVQVTWLGLPATTGLPAMDWFLADSVLMPPGSEALVTEKVWRLDRPYLCPGPQDTRPPPGPLPLHVRGQATFGYFGRLDRLVPPVLETWGALLQALPGARLLLNAHPFRHPDSRAAFLDRFAAHGVPVARVELLCDSPPWLAYQQVDVALDPWPCNAGTTTLDALGMGCPVVAMNAEPPRGRLAASILTPLGLADWLSDTPRDYVGRAVAAIRDADGLAALRAALPARLAGSSLADAADMARHFVQALEAMDRQARET